VEDGGASASLEARVRAQLTEWFGPEVSEWQLLRVYRIPHAQPDQTPPALEPLERPVALPGGLFVCGDHRDTASLHGALLSGRRTAEAVARSLEESRTGGPS
jgi:predicted NAD/FAD-dependent oxidoreductase